ncbi:MAG: helix-turn-helix domain-containing protein [Candidatus Bathyarchaeota archaeon]|nr:MAG: helix-turn-helix domain-containing protein [Candidatus Bathyarchaeota archaeon]
MDRAEILDNAESLFEKAGFYLSKRCCARPSCFDFVARNENQRAFVKVHPTIGNAYKKDARGLATLARLFSGSALFICEKTRSKPLEDDTVYSRYGVGAVTLVTLEDSLLNGIGSLIEAGPGGYYVRLDGEAIRKKRLEKGLSIGKMADIMGVSRRTLYGYEQQMAKASVLTAYKLEWVLGEPVVKPIDIFQYPEQIGGFFAAAKRIFSENRFLQFVTRKLLQCNFAVFQIKRAPFDFVAKTPEIDIDLLGAVVHGKERNFMVRTEEIVSVSKTVEAQPIFVTDDQKASATNVPLFQKKDLEKIKCPEDLMAKL